MLKEKRIVSFLIALALILSAFAASGAVTFWDENAAIAAELAIPTGKTTYDFTKLTSTTLAAGTEGFDGFSGTVSTLSSDSKNYVQINRSSTDSLTFVTEGTWSATFSSTHSNNAKGILIIAPDGKIYGKNDRDTGLTLTNMPKGEYRLTAVTSSVEADDGTGNLASINTNHAYLTTAEFTVESDEPPTDVTNLTAAAGDGAVALSWDRAYGAVSYDIYVSGALEPINTEETFYTVDGLENGVEYEFRVIAKNSVGESDGASVKATPAEPTDPPGEFILSAAAGDGQVSLSWSESEYASSYEVYRSGAVVANGLAQTSYIDTGLVNGTEYSYSVTAVNKYGTVISNTVYATPEEPEPSHIKITGFKGWLESAYVTWTNGAAVEKYNVYYKATGDTEYTKIDDELIRFYDEYYRADVLGLSAGAYTIKIAAVENGAETDYAETGLINVEAQAREGFAFDPRSPYYNAEGVGGYKNDGTLKDGAQVIYVDNNNVNTVKHTVMVKDKPTEAEGLINILSLREKNGAETTPLVIRVIGQVKDIEGINSSRYAQIKATSNVTLEGVGDDAVLYGWSLLLRDSNNIEVRNLAVMEFYDDGISLDTDNFNCWIHNVDIFYGQNRGGDQKKGDGSLDVKSGSSYITLSYNHFWDSGKTSLCGMTQDTEEFFVTYHHNWFDHSDSRHARVRRGTIHIYNNYFDGNSKYGVGATNGSSIFVEANVFRNCKNPVLASLQGTDALGEGTFSGENGGMIKMYNNSISGDNTADIIDAKTNLTSFDAYIAQTRDERVPDTYKTLVGETAYNNFDTEADMYSYTPDSPEDVVADVEKYAGRIENGDFEHEFNDEVDDADSERDPVLGAELEQYKTSLVYSYVGGGEYPATSGAEAVSYEYEFIAAEFIDNALHVELKYNGDETAPTAKLLVAAYDVNGALIDFRTFAVSGTEVGGADGYIKPDAASSARLYIWKDAVGMEPLSETVRI